jgi:hypothetical protein
MTCSVVPLSAFYFAEPCNSTFVTISSQTEAGEDTANSDVPSTNVEDKENSDKNAPVEEQVVFVLLSF